MYFKRTEVCCNIERMLLETEREIESSLNESDITFSKLSKHEFYQYKQPDPRLGGPYNKILLDCIFTFKHFMIVS